MSHHGGGRLTLAVALTLALLATPGAASPSPPATQAYPGLLSLTTIYTLQPCLVMAASQTEAPAGSCLDNTQRWYFSFLTQQRVIAAQADELTQRLRRNLIGTDEFLQRLDPLLQRADRLYMQWKRIGAKHAERLAAGETRKTGPARIPPVIAAKTTVPAPGSNADQTLRDDAAVGKCLNYLRLSIVNLFLGYADSNGRQIEDAELQAGLSGLWRSKSLSFIRALEPGSDRPES